LSVWAFAVGRGGLFCGHYQTGTYFFEWPRGEQVVREPVSLQRVRSLITEPEPDSEVEQGELPIRGVGWCGAAPIARAEVRIGRFRSPNMRASCQGPSPIQKVRVDVR
jgi:hypothetical protein